MPEENTSEENETETMTMPEDKAGEGKSLEEMAKEFDAIPEDASLEETVLENEKGTTEVSSEESPEKVSGSVQQVSDQEAKVDATVLPLSARPAMVKKPVEQHSEMTSSKAPAAPSTELVLSSPVSLETLKIEVDFLLGSKRLSLSEINDLAEGQVLLLEGSQFQVTLSLQERAIAEAQLVTVDGHPAAQITKLLQ